MVAKQRHLLKIGKMSFIVFYQKILEIKKNQYINQLKRVYTIYK